METNDLTQPVKVHSELSHVQNVHEMNNARKPLLKR